MRERVRERERGDEGVRRDAGRCGGVYSLGNRKEGAGGWRGRGAGMRERARRVVGVCGRGCGKAGKGAEAAGEGEGCGRGAGEHIA